MEKQINREEIYKGKVIEVVKDEILFNDKKRAFRELVLHRGGACIALLDPEDNKYFMVRQFRYAFNDDLLEFCAGKLEKGETPLEAILRESIEEIGYEAIDVKSYGYIIPTCGYSNEKIYLFSGIKGKYIGQHFDEDECVKREKYSIEEIKEMISKGKITDAKTIALVYHLSSF